jgi:hypothetical protein
VIEANLHARSVFMAESRGSGIASNVLSAVRTTKNTQKNSSQKQNARTRQLQGA